MPLLDKIHLGPVELNPDINLRGLLAWSPVVLTEYRTVDGLHRVAADTISGGRPLTLDGAGGYFTVGEIRQVRALQMQAAPVLLVHHQGTYRVWIKEIQIDGQGGLWIDDVDYADEDNISAQILLVEAA